MEKPVKMTWDELADEFKAATGRSARTKPMETVFEWATKQTDKYFVDDDGYLWRLCPNSNKKEE